MKANQTGEQYAGKVRECTNYAVRSVKSLYKDNVIGKHRQPCGEDDKKVGDICMQELRNFCDTVDTQTFSTDVAAHKVSNIWTLILMIIAAAAAIAAIFLDKYYTILLIGSLIFSILSLLAYVGAFGGTSKNIAGENIIGIRKAGNTASKKIIFTANTDAPFSRKRSRKAEAVFSVCNLLGIFIYLAFDIVSVLKANNIISFDFQNFSMLSFILIAFLPFPILLATSVKTNASSNGVTDNLTGCYACLGALRYMSISDLRLDDTDICVLLTGGKNAGNAGAKAYEKEFGESDRALETTVIALDTLNSSGDITVKDAKGKYAKVIASAFENAGCEYKTGNIKYLKGDGKIFAKKKTPCVTLTSLPEEAPDYYKSDLDNCDLLDPKPVEQAIKVMLEAAYLKDAPAPEKKEKK
jgi:hypothetical protein